MVTNILSDAKERVCLQTVPGKWHLKKALQKGLKKKRGGWALTGSSSLPSLILFRLHMFLLATEKYYLLQQYHSQNHRDWKGPLVITSSRPPAQVGSSGIDCPGPHPVGF